MVVPISLTNVVEDAEGVEQFAGRPGSGQAQTPPGVPGQSGERLVADVEGAGDADESGDGIDERRLVCAVGADEGRDLAWLGFHGHIAVGRMPPNRTVTPWADRVARSGNLGSSPDGLGT